jgi:transglutaminase-like putative cysteine protease
MNLRLTITSAVAVLLASFSLLTVIQGVDWMYAGLGAIAVVAAAGLATRLPPIPAAAVATGLVLIAVIPLLTGPSWWVRAGGLALVAIMAGSAVSRRVLPALADVGTYLGALLIYLNLLFAGPQSWAWIIPTMKSFNHLGRQISIGYSEHQYAPPVPATHGMQLIAAAGIGAVAILVDVIAVRMRSPAVAGLPLLVLFSVPVATDVKHVGTGLTLAFCLGITGYLALLATDGRDRLRLWGRLVTVWQEMPEDETAHGPDTRALAASGRRIGLAAVAVAVFVPLVLPGLNQHGLLGTNPVPGHGGGGSQVAPPAPLVQMRTQLFHSSARPFLTYKTTAANPAEQYLQVYVLNYDNAQHNWGLTPRSPSTTINDSSQVLRSAPGLAPATNFSTAHTTITIGKTSGYKGQMNYLPLPYAPQFLTVGKGWQETNSTLMVYGYRPDSGLKYSVTTRTATPTPAQLPAKAKLPASLKPYLAYAGPNRQALLQRARAITAGATTRLSQAEALENYFTQPGNFTYTLRGNLPSSVLEFLTTNKKGFCQQFAFAMAVLARLLDIPSRIAVGYTAGTPIGHHTWQVTTADAHAWPELYIPGAGWLRFEPTPGGADAQGTATRPVYAVPTPGGNPTTGPAPGTAGGAPLPSTGVSGGLPGNKKPLPGAGDSSSLGATASKGGFPVGPVVGLVAILAIIAPGLTRALTRRRRWLAASSDAGRAHAAWRELTSDLVDHGIGGAASESPRAVAKRVGSTADLDPAGRQSMDRIAAAEERARYAREPAPSDSLKSDVQIVRRAIARNASPAERWRARLLPASTLAPVLAGLRQAPDIFGWLDAAGLGLRRSVGRALRPRRAA